MAHIKIVRNERFKDDRHLQESKHITINLHRNIVYCRTKGSHS